MPSIGNLYIAFLFAFLLTLAGFWPSVAGGGLDGLRIAHGMLATLWMAMLVAQSWLAGHRHMRWHRRMGWCSVIVVPALIVTAFALVDDMLRHSVYFPLDLRITLAWIDVWSILLFGLLWLCALARRKHWPVHARYMASTVFVAIIPALGRLYGRNIPALDGLSGALHPSFLTVELVLIALVVRDRAKGGPAFPYIATLTALLAVQVTMFEAPRWPLVRAVASALGAPA